MVIISVDPGSTNFALTMIRYKFNDPNKNRIYDDIYKLDFKSNLIVQRNEKEVYLGQLLFSTVTDIDLTTIGGIIKTLSHILNLENTFLVYERFVTYGRYSMKNIENINQIIGALLTRYYEYGGQEENVKAITYKQWSSYLCKISKLQFNNVNNKTHKSILLFNKFFKEIPEEIETFKQFGDHILDSMLLSFYALISNKLTKF